MKDVIIKRQYFLTYSTVYGDFDKFNIRSALKSIPTITAIERISFILSQISSPVQKDKNLHVITLYQWILKIASEDNKKTSKIIQEKAIHNQPQFRFINAESCLMLIEYLLENNNLNEQELTEEQESNLYKSYLWCTEIAVKKQVQAFNCDGTEDIATLICRILPSKLNNREINLLKDYRIQFIKIVYFFRFCETESQYRQYLSLFLQEYNIESWDRYLLNLITFYLTQINNTEVTPKFNTKSINPNLSNFLDNLYLKELTNYKRTDDFNGLRNHPILRYGEYGCFLFLNFFVDKIYQGFMFDFVQVLNKNQCKISTFPDLKNDLGQKFSERIPFYKTMDLCFRNYTNIRLEGEYIKKFLKQGEPDYYMRHGNKVFLFEFKDSTLNSSTKHSIDFKKIKKSIIEKFEETSKKRKKGIRQIIDTIKQIQESKFNRQEFDMCDPQKISIYPILVHTDSSFEVEGTNYILKERFNELLVEEDISNRNFIKNLVLINLDTFILVQDLFQINKLKLSTCINDYINFTCNNRNGLNALYSFDQFVLEKAYRKGYKNLAPKVFTEMVKELVEKDK